LAEDQLAKIKKQYASSYVDRRRRKLERRGAPPARYSIPRLRLVMASTLARRNAATIADVVDALENAAGANGTLDERTTGNLYTRRHLASSKKARPIADAFEQYCAKNGHTGRPVLEIYDAALPPQEANRAVYRLGKALVGNAHSAIANLAGLSVEVVRTLCNGHVAPSRIVSHVAATLSALGAGSVIPVGWDTITWPRHLPPELSARDTIETWLANN